MENSWIMPPSKTNEHYTPRWIFDALGVEFDVDVCSPGRAYCHTFAHTHYVKYPSKTVAGIDVVVDSLEHDWAPGMHWMNPPYERGTINAFMKKFSEHDKGIALVFARTDTQWWHEYVAQRASAVLFIKGRLKFDTFEKEADGAAPAPSALIGYGEAARKALRRASDSMDIPGDCMESV